jgi:pectate lyase
LVGFAAIPFAGVSTTTGGAGGRAVKVSNLTDLRLHTDSNETLIIFVQGTINMGGMVPLRSNKTIMGLSGAKLTGGGFEIYNRSNIIIRNITFEDAPDDSLKINQNTHHVWVDHCTFSDGAVADPEGANHDGLFDITRQTTHITISHNHFKNHNKTMLIGHSDSASGDTGYLKTTIHDNWFDGTLSRHPRVRFGEVHVFNNYYLNNSTYGIASTMEADVLVEGNYFQNVPSPMLVGYAESGPGDIVQRNNIFVSSGTPQTRGTAFNPASYYSYTVADPSTVPSRVMNNAGVGKIDPWAATGVAPF